MHYGEDEFTPWGPIQDVKSDHVMHVVLRLEKPDFVLFTGNSTPMVPVVPTGTPWHPLVPPVPPGTPRYPTLLEVYSYSYTRLCTITKV